MRSLARVPEATAKIQLSNSLEDGTTFISTNTVFTGNYTPASNEDKKYLYGPGVTVTLGDTFVFTASAGKSFSIKPGATPGTVLDAYTFQYEYDERNRIIRKKVPGAEWVYMAYDKWDRLVLTQDGEQRAKTTKEWTFTKYDALNHPIITGTYKNNSSHASLINNAMTSTNRYENELNTDGSTLAEVDYVNGFQYEEGALSFLTTQEGRAIKNGNDYEYEYFLTDHLGNTWLTFGWLKDKDVFKATMETENNTEESANFIKLDTRAISLANNHTASYEVAGIANEAARLNGYETPLWARGLCWPMWQRETK